MPELQDVFRRYGARYRQSHGLPVQKLRAMTAIEQCRTAKLGGHLDVCENCGDTKISYNSCRNRHCPKCQSLAKEKWIDHQKHNLLDIGYFHVVFTVPDDLRPVIYQNQAQLYALLFRAAAETLQTLAADKKYLGAKIGLTSILHTWGQSLSYHPHIHCIVPGGGLTGTGHWKSSSKKFFLHVCELFHGIWFFLFRSVHQLRREFFAIMLARCVYPKRGIHHALLTSTGIIPAVFHQRPRSFRLYPYFSSGYPGCQ